MSQAEIARVAFQYNHYTLGGKSFFSRASALPRFVVQFSRARQVPAELGLLTRARFFCAQVYFEGRSTAISRCNG